MKETPILFSGPMVLAIMDGRKTQTRRVVKLPKGLRPFGVTLTRMQDGFKDGGRPIFGIKDEPNAFSVRNRYGGTGDRLWVRETFRLWDHSIDTVEVEYKAGGERCVDGMRHKKPHWLHDRLFDKTKAWRPSIFMPKWSSRITLEIVSVQVERLQEITEEDAKAEGVEASETVEMKDGLPCYTTPYQILWRQINGCDSWADNPYVWRIEFKRMEG